MPSPLPTAESLPPEAESLRLSPFPDADSAESSKVTPIPLRSSSEPRGAAPESPVLPGAILSGRYVVGNVLASGGMGIVCSGRHMELGQPVAIKFLRSDVSERPSVVQRFLNEGRAAAVLRSEHVVRVMDVGQLDSGRPYLVMEHLEGRDLDTVIENEGPLDVDRAIEFILQVCSALSEAHINHIVHRDIKPENLFLVAGTRRPLVKVLDFGLAKRIDAAQGAGLTNPEDSLGSPYYMSPEQIVSPHQVDERTDIWSVGVVLYRMLTGIVPFKGDTVLEVFARVLNAQPQPMRAVRPEIDEDLEAIVARCLEKDAAQRFQSAQLLSRELQKYRGARKAGLNVAAPSSTPPAVYVDDSPVHLPGVHSRWPAAVVGALALAGALLYAADKTGRVDLQTPLARAEARLDQYPIYRDVSGRVRAATGGMLALPPMAMPEEIPVPRQVFVPRPLDANGVITLDPAEDADGRRALRAVPEVERATAEDPAIGLDVAEARRLNYQKYLDQNGLVPLKDALDKIEPGAMP